MESFLRMLSESREWLRWHVDGMGMIRGRDNNGQNFCPLEVIINKPGQCRADLFRYGLQKAIRKNGLYPYQAMAVIAAADDHKNHDRELRRRILKAVGPLEA